MDVTTHESDRVPRDRINSRMLQKMLEASPEHPRAHFVEHQHQIGLALRSLMIAADSTQ